MDLSIIIVNRDTEELLEECLLSLRRSKRTLSWEIWVVDNASEDGSVQMVQTEFPEVKLVVNRENLGFARANNLALLQSAGRYCLLLNPDTVVRAGALDRLVQFMQDTPDAGVAACAQVYPGGQWQITCHRDITLFREAFITLGLAGIFRGAIDYQGHPEAWTGPRQVDWVEGGVLLVRKTALEAVSQMDEAFFMYAEDADLCFRVRQAGFQVYYVPGVEIVHHRAQATGLVQRGRHRQRVNPALLLALHQSKAHYIRKHHGGWQEKVYRLLVRLYCVRKLTMSLTFYLLGMVEREMWAEFTRAYIGLAKADLSSSQPPAL